MGIKKGNFVMFQVDKGWIVYNTAKPFSAGHTHLKSKAGALAAIDFVLKEKIPRKSSFYYLISLIRISDNENYSRKVRDLMNVRKGKGKKQTYINSR